MDILWTPWRHEYVSTVDSAARQGVPPQLAAWKGDTGCAFCNILEATAHAVHAGMSQADADRAANILWRGTHNFICLNAFPYTTGHAMVLPYSHTDEMWKLELPVAQEFIALMQRLEKALRRVYHPDGINLGMNLGKAAGAGITGHLHMHMLPRWIGDTNFMTVTSQTRVLPETLDITAQRLRDALAEAE